LQEILNQDGDIFSKLKKIGELKKYRNNMEEGIKNQSIFHDLKEQDKSIRNLMQKFEYDDDRLVFKLFNEDVKDFLKKNELNKNLDFSKRQDSKQIGFNTIFVEKPMVGLWTTGKATFFIPTTANHETKILLKLQSLVPVNVEIEFEGELVHKEEFQKMTSKKIEMNIDDRLVNDSVSQISVRTDNLWLPNIILGLEPSVKIGIKIDSITVLA